AQVRRLEEDLGCTLLVRVGRDQMRPTPAGGRLCGAASPFLDRLPIVLEELASGRASGTLRVDAAALEIRYVLPPWLRLLREQSPEIRIELEDVPSADLSRLASAKTDLVVDFVESVPAGFASVSV